MPDLSPFLRLPKYINTGSVCGENVWQRLAWAMLGFTGAIAEDVAQLNHLTLPIRWFFSGLSMLTPLCLAQSFLIQRAAVHELFGAAFSSKMVF